MNWTSDTRATVHPNVVTADLHNQEAVLLHLDTTRYFTLNTTGAVIWDLFGQGLTAGQIGECLTDLFEVTPEAAQGAVFDLGRDLAAQDLLTPAAATT